MKKVLVTGGSGFIGSHTVEELINKEYEVIVLDNFSTGRKENIAHLSVPCIEEDVTKPEVVEIIKKIAPDYIIHLAAQVSVAVSVNDYIYDQEVNIKGSLHVIKAASEAGVKKVVFASSAAVYGDPVYLPVDTAHQLKPGSPYGLSKLTVERYLEMAKTLYDVDYCILRYSNVYGPRQDALGEGGVVSIFSDKFAKDEAPFIFGDGEQTRDFIYVGDLAAANVAALTAQSNVCLNISCGDSITVNELFQTMKRVTGSHLEPIYKAQRAGDIVHSTLSNEETKQVLSWEPVVSLQEGLARTISYYEQEVKA
ncbi:MULTISPECIES: NAD-dependent epimerase/dehydratase family protein [Bacillus]|uniref:NAD-dependent epimerase/dehydratase family protein n=1 Tax=Bacillus TaxID=1386 RepID=UPI000D21DFE1|nr:MULTISPECIES: NAD-dependent epimerase/dehydratase family protein [Bacillus]AVI42528.1 UDP-glucose 4-epimerase [Bacillus pumilus]MBU8724715.1 NAD-dependent epimerase/dehydratase family protein [Bacillus pumilus]MCP1150318.1 NAD-dependent epimerase/dehydratase family protein [Bacillus sp. 1735sda2]QHQ75460.1 NAD-dependent epimerase/dehydratase family protein [Bacillus pumilus]